MSMQTLAMFALVAFAVGGVIWVFVYPIISGERHAELRQQSVTRAEPAAASVAAARASPKARREQIEESIKELELRQKKAKNVPLPLRISQAGLSWSKRQFIIASAVVGLVLFVAGFLMSGSPLIAAGLGFAGAFGIPRWLLTFLKKRREA
jgi:tight adherence protein B